LKASFTAPGTSVFFEQFRDKGGDAAAFRPRQRHMPKQRITFQDFHDCTNSVVSTDPQIVALCDVVGEHNFGVVPIRDMTVSSTFFSSDWASSTITQASCRLRPRIWVSGRT